MRPRAKRQTGRGCDKHLLTTNVKVTGTVKNNKGKSKRWKCALKGLKGDAVDTKEWDKVLRNVYEVHNSSQAMSQ